MRIICRATLGAALLLATVPAFAAQDEKPLVETQTNFRGDKLKVEIYQRGPVTLDLAKLSIAQRRLLGDRYGDVNGPIDRLMIDCSVDASGTIQYDGRTDYSYLCAQAGQDASQARKARYIIRLFGIMAPTLPSAPAIRAEKSPPPRQVRFDVTVLAPNGAIPTPVDGPLVDKTEIVGLNEARAKVTYPARAIRSEVGGTLISLCEVEPDFSVSCRYQSFSPAEYAEYFMDIAPELLLGGRVGATLTGGKPAVGAHFLLSTGFRINQND